MVAEVIETPPELDLSTLEHIFIGPTWTRDDNGDWVLPDHTLGWQVAGWCTEFLRNDEGEPWKFTLEQLRFILWWYAVDEHGRFVYRMGVLQRMKGWGKDPLLAVMCLVELCGPSRFSHWEDGQPIAKPHPSALVQVAAVTQEQTGNTMDMMPSLMSDHFRATYRIKASVELIRANGGKQKLQAVTSNYRALEGKRSTFVVLNETHHWVTGNNGHKMFETVDGNVTKMDGRYLSITNAYMPGEESVAEKQRRAYNESVSDRGRFDVGFLYDSIEADPRTPLTEAGLRQALPHIRGDAYWLNIETIIKSVQNTQIAQARSRRMFLNQIVAEEDALYDPAQLKAIERDTVLSPGDEIVLGFDGGKTDDATALVAIRVSDRTAFVLHLQQKPLGPNGEGWQVNRFSVDAAVHEAFRDYNVRAFFADVALWESYIDNWAEEFGEELEVKATGAHAVGWDMRRSQKEVTFAHERLMQSIFDEAIGYDKTDHDLYTHTMNARRRENNWGVSFSKESRESTRKVDAYAALMLAHEALHRLRTAPAKPKKVRTGVGYFF